MVEEGQEGSSSTSISILEAMILEINIKAPDDQAQTKAENLLVQPGETIRAAGRIALLSNAAS